MLIDDFEIDIRPPSINGLYQSGKVYKDKKTGRLKSSFYMSKKGTDFKKEMRTILRKLYKEKPVEYLVKIHWQFFYKGKRGGDWDSGVKISNDCLEGIVFNDDNQIKKSMVELFEPAEKDQVRIKIYKLTEKELNYIEQIRCNISNK